MSLFKKAEKEATRLKMYIYGESGTGKTTTCLSFPDPAVVDAELGSLYYGDTFDFHRIESNDPKVLDAAINELLVNPGNFKTFVIDPFTAIYDKIVQAKEDRMRLKTGDASYEIKGLDYKSIKNEVKILVNKLLSLDMNIIVTARSKSKYAEGEFMKKIGNVPEGHKELPYMFDVILELSIKDDGTRVARVEKDRTNRLPHEFEFSYQSFVDYIGLESLERKADVKTQTDSLSKRTGRTTKIEFQGDDVYTAGVDAKTLDALSTALENYDPEDLKETLKNEYGIESLLDLTKTTGKALLRALEEKKQ